MLTNRTISNISYNSSAFLDDLFDKLVRDNVIEWAYWIYHDADTDDKKQHAHIVLKPSKRLDTDALRHRFDELDPAKPDKPFSVTSKWNFTNSLDDWLLYAVHDRAYLTYKGLERKHFYKIDDVRSTDPDALLADWNAIDRRRFDRLAMLQDAVDNGVPFALLVQEGIVPIAQRAQWQWQYIDLVRMSRGMNDFSTDMALSIREDVKRDTARVDKMLSSFKYDGDADDDDGLSS